VKPQNLTWDEAIYPRSAVNRKTVEAYVEALSIGAQFPAVKVQQVLNYTPGGDLLAIVLIIIDGVHRWFAFTEAGPAAQETPDHAVTLFDYHDLLSQTGWQTTHRIECPLSTQRLTSTQVQRMQTKRILGTIGRTLLIARRT